MLTILAKLSKIVKQIKEVKERFYLVLKERKEDIILFIVILLVSLFSFAFGYIIKNI